MKTARGTDYAILRKLAIHGAIPAVSDCELAERQGRLEHALGFRELSLLTLLCARALWAARRYHLSH